MGRIAASRQPLETNSIDAGRGFDVGWATEQGLVAFGGYPLAVQSRLVRRSDDLRTQSALRKRTFKPLRRAAGRISLGIERRSANRAGKSCRPPKKRRKKATAAKSMFLCQHEP